MSLQTKHPQTYMNKSTFKEKFLKKKKKRQEKFLKKMPKKQTNPLNRGLQKDPKAPSFQPVGPDTFTGAKKIIILT